MAQKESWLSDCELNDASRGKSNVGRVDGDVIWKYAVSVA